MEAKPFDDASGPRLSLEDVRNIIASSSELAEATRRDYEAQIDKFLVISNANRLADIPANLSAFCRRHAKKDFPREHFRTHKAYLAWRKKMVSILKRALGVFAQAQERRVRQDDWAVLLTEWSIIRPGRNSGKLAIGLLADEARKSGLGPGDLEFDWLVDLMDKLPPGRRTAILRSVRLLEKARAESPSIDMLLGGAPLSDPAIVRRAAGSTLPAQLERQLFSLVEAHCGGEIDEISNERIGRKAKATFDSYRAALRKYLRSALASGTLPHSADIADAFERPVFIEVMRLWNSETRRSHRISDRSKRSYVSCIMTLAAECGQDVGFMKKALDLNPNLKNGRAEANTMPLETRNFCMRLLRFRDSEMIFKSLHLRFRDQAVSLLSAATPTSLCDFRIVQLGVLAAFSAIALWGVPLRIDNLRCLRHRGENPTLVLPNGGRQRAYLLIPEQDVKNRKPIRAHISDGPTRALEIIEWYLDVIRPRVPWADRSNYLFPGYEGELISAGALRGWLQDHGRNLGLPMNPHNFRHGLASIYLRDHPGEYSQAARLLCNTPETVRAHYAWIDEEAEMRVVQEKVAQLGGFRHGR